MYGIGGQLVGHGVVWGKQIAGGRAIGSVLTSETLFWAAFSIVSETLTTQATNLLGTSTAGIAAPVMKLFLKAIKNRCRVLLGQTSWATQSINAFVEKNELE